MNSGTQDYNTGAPLQGAQACPHCGAVAHVRQQEELRYVCNVCGGPRIELTNREVALSGNEMAPLQQAKSALGSRRLWRVGAIVGALGTAAVSGITLIGLLFGFGAGWMTAGIIFALPLIAMLAGGISRSRAHSQTIARAIHAAWQSAAKDVALDARDGITAEQLAQQLHLPVSDAEHLLTQLNIEDQLQSHITEEGQLSFSPSLRIAPLDAPAQAQAMGLDAELEALAAEHEASRKHNQSE